MIEAIYLLICFSALLLSAVFNSEQDTINYNPYLSWFTFSWWVKRGSTPDKWVNNMNKIYQTKLWNIVKVPTIWWLLKYPFSFLLDGWHFCKSLSILFILVPIPLGVMFLGGYGFNIFFLIWLGTYFIYGLLFNFFYHN